MMQKFICPNPVYWEIKDGKRTYVIGGTDEDPMAMIDKVNVGYLKDIKWDNDTLIINAIVSARCGDNKLFGNYKLGKDVDTIDLVVSETRPLIYPLCMAYYDVTFKTKNLQKKDYKILLYTDVMGQGKLLIDEEII